MSYNFYKILHLTGIIMLFMSYGAILLHGFTQQKKDSMPQRKLVMLTNGIGLTLTFVAGFGLLAKMPFPLPFPWPAWVWLKLSIWLFFGVGSALVLRKPQFTKFWWLLFIALGALAVFLARTKLI